MNNNLVGDSDDNSDNFLFGNTQLLTLENNEPIGLFALGVVDLGQDE